MKKRIAFLLACLMAASLTACGKDEDDSDIAKKGNQDIVREDAGGETGDSSFEFFEDNAESVTGDVVTETEKKAKETKKNLAPENAAPDACGDNLTWSYDEDTATLYIEGEGDMWDFVVINEDEYHFSNCPWSEYEDEIKNVLIDNGVSNIGEKAFYDCESLINIAFPESVLYIGDDAFFNNISLTNIELPNSLTSIGNNAFSGCESITGIKLSNKLTSIGEGAFSGTNIKNIDLPDSLINIGEYAFSHCHNITNIEIPLNVTHIGKNFTLNCYSLTDITVDKNNNHYCDQNGILFNKNASTIIYYSASRKETEYTIPDSVTRIDDNAFRGCENLETIILPDSITSIGTNAFSGSGITSIKIPSKVTNIGNNVFSYCLSLKSVKLPDSITSVDDEAFFYCINLENIEIPNNVTNIGNNAFEWCESLKSIEIPNSIVSIGALAFASCDSLENISIPNCITTIGDEAFAYCNSLETINFAGTEQQWEAFGLDEEDISDAKVLFAK